MTVDLSEPDSTDRREPSYCGAKKRQGEGTCRLPAGHGTDHVGTGRCKRHGGNTPTQRAAVAAQILELKVTQLFGQTYDDKPVDNPLAAFAELTGKVIGWMRVLENLVAKLNSPGYQAMTGEQIKAEVQLFERALDRCNTVLSTHARLNIDARLAAISAAQAAMVMGAIESALAAAGVSGARAIEAKRAAGAKLRVLEGTAVDPLPRSTTP